MPDLTKQDRERIYTMRYEDGREWAEIYAAFPDQARPSLRHIAYRIRDRRQAPNNSPPAPRIEGATLAEGDTVDEAEIWRLAIQKSVKKRLVEERKANSLIEFDRGPVAIVFFADIHAGSTGVDYARLEGDLDIIRSTPGMYAVCMGDLVDNFIIGRLLRIRMGAEFSITEEWALAKHVLLLLGPKLVASIAGNHDLWTYALTGIDYLQEVQRQINPAILYARYDQSFIVAVAGNEFRIRARHKWKGYSQYNDTHGIEKASKFDKGREFDIGVGAHTHASGLYRQFNNGGRTGHAILCGSYKIFDRYAEDMGFALANEAAPVAMVLSGGGAFGTNDLHIAAEYMREVYKA